MIWAAAKMIFGLGAVMAILLLLIWVCKRMPGRKGSFPSEGQVRLLTSKPIAPRKFVSLVEIGGQILVLGVSEAQITLLHKIENPEFIARTETQQSPGSERLSIFGHFSLRRRALNRALSGILNGK
jgi:flagellar biosynthetic protein FliO